MKTLPVQKQTINAGTGEVAKTETVHFNILPPGNPAACKTCGREHPAEQPHDAQHLHYQYAFYGEHGRWPTWKDAVAHCADDVKEHWERELRRAGAWSEPPPSNEGRE